MLRVFFISICFLLSSFGVALAAPSADDFGALPLIHDAALSPNGNEIAVLVNKDGRYIIRVSKLADLTEAPRLIALGKEMKPEYLKWVNNKRLILSFWQSEEIFQTPIQTGYLYTLDTVKMKGRILINPTKADPGFSQSTDIAFRQFNNIVVDWLENDPDHILMTFGDDNNRRPDLRKVKVKSGQDSIVKRGLINVQTWYTDQRGEPRVGQGRREDSGEWNLRIRDAEDDKWRLSDEFPGLPPNVDIHGFTSNPNELIISAYQGQDTIGLYVYDLSAKKITRKIYHNASYDATGVVLSSETGDVIGAEYTSESPETEMFEGHDTLMSRMRAQFDDYNVSYVDQSEKTGKALFRVSSATDPGYLMIVENAEKPRSLGALRPQISTDDLGTVIGVAYKSRDGQAIPSFITLPPSITDVAQLQNLPFIIHPHGGPYARDSKRFDYLAQFFASQGYGVLQMNFRGSEGYGKTFKESGRDNWVVMQEDVEDGAKWLISEGLADPKRICIAGWSYGGYAALIAAAKNPDLYSCAISMAGLTDIKDHIRDREQYRFGDFGVKGFFGKGFEDKDDIRANSPVKLADQIKIPVLLAHGKDDQVVHFDQFRRMKSALKKGQSKATYVEFNDGDHYLSLQKDRQKFLAEVESFLKKSNGKSEFAK